jgi:hypothetical protein
MDNFSDLQKDIDSAIYSAYQFGNVTGAPQNTTFNGDVAAQMLKENIKTTPSLVSTSGGVPSVYGDSQMNLTFERYYMHPNFSRLGYSPWRDNDRLYNENSSWLDNTSRSIKAMGHIAMESFGSNKPFISTLDLFDPLNYDEESAGSISRMMKLGYDTSGGLGAFTNNFLLNSGITLGITASALVEEAVIAGASALMAKTGVGIPAAVGTLGVGTAATIGKFARNIGKVFNANDLVFKLARNTDELKQVYDFSKMGRALDNKVVDFFNPLSNTAKLLKEYPETFKGLNALGKTATSFGAFYADARAAARVLNEAQMEGGLVLNQMVEDGIRKEYDATGQYPTEEKIAGIKEAAQNAAFATTMINLPLIFFSNKVGLDNIIKNLPKGKNLISALDDVKQFGSFSKIKGQGYKYLTSPLQKISAGARPVEIAKSFLNYTRYNFSEAIQENLQEATSAGVINYYKKLFENPMIDQHMLLKESVALGIGEQFTGQGLETFFSGFLTGGLMGGMGKIANLGINVGQRIYDPVAFKDYQDEKKKLKEELEESANYLDKNFLDLGRGPIDMINPNAVNAAQQSAASKTMNASNQTGNVKVSKDAQRLSLFEHVSNAIKGGFYNNIIDDYKSQLAVDDKTLAEAFGRDITEVPKLRSDISNAIADAENIKKLHDKYNFGNPVNLKSVSKDDPKYRQLLARYNAFETVRKMLIMSEDTIKDGAYRMNKITESLMTLLPEFGELDSDDILTLVDTFRLEAYKFDQIKQELELAKSTQSSPSTTPEDREKARIKEQYISRKLIALTDLHTKLKSFRSKKKTNTEFTDDERSALSGAYNAYISVLNQNPERKSSVVTTTNLDESLNYILDYISLESENELLTSIISVLQDPQGFATTVNDTTNYLEQILNDTSFVSKMVNRGVSLLEHNAIYNFMFTKFGVYVKEYEDGSVAFERPSANVVDALIPVDPLSEEYEEMLNAFFDKKEALSKIDATTEKIKKTKKVQADRVAKDKRDFETIKAALKKEDPSLSDEALDRKSRFILMIPQLRDLYIQDSVLDGLAQNIEDAASTPTTKEEVEEALKLLEAAKFIIVEDPDTGTSYYVQVDEEGNPLEESLEWKRVTSLYKTKEFGGTKKFTHRGNIIDGLLRALIGDKSLTKEQFKEAYVELQKENPEAFEFTDDNLTTLRSTLDNFIASIESQGYTLRANIPTLWGTIDGQNVAGTMDIIAVNDKGETLLIDLKTSSSNRRKAYAMEAALKKAAGNKYNLVKEKIIANGNKIKGDVSKGEKNLLNDSEIGDILNNFLSIEDDSKIKPYVDVNAIFFYKDSDENQLNAYADLLEQRTGIKVSGLFVLPLTIQDNNNNKTYTKIEAATEKINNKDRYALKVSRKQPIAPKIETTETPKTEEKEVVEEETLEEEPLTEEEIKLRDERVELINKTIGLLEKRKEKGVQSITNVENTLEYLKELLDETSELSFEEVKKILNTIKTLEEAISSNSARKSKRGQAISLSIEEYKKQFRTEKQLFNDIANRIKYLKEDLQQLKQIDKDLSDQINYYRNMIANKDFKTLSFEEIEEKIEIINKKKSVLEKIIASLLRVIKQSVFYLKEYVKITTKSINDLEIFKKNTNFKRLNTEELKKLIDAEDSSATTEYDKLRKQADELEKAIENNLDSIEIVEGAKQKEQERLDDLYNVVQKYNNQLRYLNNLLTVLYPDLAKIKLEKATAGKTAKEQVAPGVKKAPAPTAKPSPQKTEARLEDAKKEKAKAEKRTTKPKKEKPTTTPTAQPTVSDKKADVKGNLASQGTSIELEVIGETGKEFLLTVDRSGNISLWSEKQPDGTYRPGEGAPKEAIDKLYNKYIPEKTRIAITNWLNAFTGSWAASETEDGKKYDIAEKELNAELAALEGTGIEETDTTTNTSNIGPVSSIKLDTVYPIYKDNKQVGSVVLQSVNGIPAFVFTNSKGQVSTPSVITTLSNNFFNANEGLFEHWYNNILTDDNRQSVSLYKMATTASQKDLFVAIYGISKTVFNKNIDLLEDAVSTNEDILDTFKGKLIYGTPGVGKTQFITEYNARPESQRKHTLIDVDDLLVARLQELNAKLGFAGDLEFTNENLFAIINKFGKTFGTTERTKELDNLLYNPVLEIIKSEKAKGSILLTGTKRFIKEADIAVLSEERSNILRDRIVTGEGDVKKYLEAENRFTKQVIILKQGQPFSDVLVKGIDAVEADAAFRQLKRNLFNRMIFDDFTLVKLITELSKVNLSELNSNQLVDLFNTIITKESPFYSEIISLDGNIDEKSKELFNYFKTFYNSNETSVTDRSVLLRKIIDVLSNIAPNSISITDLNNPLSNFAVLSSVNGDNIEYNVFSSIGAEPQLKSQSISTFVTAVSKNRSKIISFRETVQGETEKIDSPEAVGKNINNLPKLDEKDIFNKPCGPINT